MINQQANCGFLGQKAGHAPLLGFGGLAVLALGVQLALAAAGAQDAHAAESLAQDAVPPVRIDAQLQFSVDEDRITTSVEYRLSNAAGRPIDLNAAPLLLPLPAPLVGGLPLDRGTIPAAAQSVEAEVTGDLKVERKHGGLVAVGVLAPGAEAMVRGRFFLGYKNSTLRLGIRGAGLQTYATVVVASSVPGRTRLATDQPARNLRLEQGDERLVGLAFAQAIGPGEVAVIELADLPAPPAAPRLALTSAAASLAALALFWLLRKKNESAHGA